MYDDGECRFHSATIDEPVVTRFRQCAASYGKAIIVLGDSHGMNAYNAIASNTTRPFVFGVSQGGCRPQNPLPNCPFEAFLSFVKAQRESIDSVLYNQAGFYLIEDSDGNTGSRELFRRHSDHVYGPGDAAIEKVSAYLTAVAAFTPVVWIGPWIEPHLNALQLIARAMRCQVEPLELEPSLVATFTRLDAHLAHLSAGTPVQYVSAIDMLEFDPRIDLYSCDAVYWKDTDHFSKNGEVVFGARMARALAAQKHL